MPRIGMNVADMENALADMAGEEELSARHELLQIEEMMVLSCLACPEEKTLRQRQQFFSKMKFSTLEELLKHAEEIDFV